MRWVLPGCCALVLGSCTPSAELLRRRADGGGVDAGAVLSWGEHTARLQVPNCPPGEEWVVDTADEGGDAVLTDRAQAGETLSLLEALRLFEGRQVPTTIRFSPDVFPASAPATITWTGTHAFFGAWSGLCVDARGRGVQLLWHPPGWSELWPVSSQSMTVGLVMLDVLADQRVTGGVLAGIRAVSRYKVVAHAGSTVGPGNAFLDSYTSVLSVEDGPVTIRGNAISYDPLTRRPLPDEEAYLFVFGDTVFEDNVSPGFSWLNVVLRPGERLDLRNNFIGAHEDGSPMTLGRQTTLGNYSVSNGTHVLGPGNVIRSVQPPVLAAGGRFEVTANSITGGPDWLFETSQAAPAVTGFDGVTASGTCAVEGARVELFSDPGRLGATYLGATSCQGGAWSRSTGAVPSGLQLTATLTAAGVTSRFSQPLPVP